MVYNLPGSSVHGIFQARILEWVAISSSRGSSLPKDRTHIYCISCIAGGSLTTESFILYLESGNRFTSTCGKKKNKKIYEQKPKLSRIKRPEGRALMPYKESPAKEKEKDFLFSPGKSSTNEGLHSSVKEKAWALITPPSPNLLSPL